MSTKGDPRGLEAELDDMPAIVRRPLEEAGFSPGYLPGPTPAWTRTEKDGTYLFVRRERSFSGTAEATDWMIGRLCLRDDGRVLATRPMRLADALEAVERIPSPVLPDGTVIEVLVAGLEDWPDNPDHFAVLHDPRAVERD